jgi:PAS domain S-box-containing protein
MVQLLLAKGVSVLIHRWMKLLYCVLFSVLILAPDLSCAAERSIRVGLYNFSPLVFADEHGKPRGLFVDILEHVAAREKWQIIYVPGAWQEGMERLLDGSIDLLVCIGYSPERARILDFPVNHVVLDWGQVFLKRHSGIKTVMDLEGKTISALKGSIYLAGFRTLLEQFQIKARIIERAELAEVFRDIRSGVADAGISANLSGAFFGNEFNMERSSIVFAPVNLGFAVKKGMNGDVVAALDRSLARLKEDKNSFYYRKLAEWLPGNNHYVPAAFWWGVWILTAILVLVVLFAALLNRQVRVKTGELAESCQELSRQKLLMNYVINGTTDAVFVKDCAGRYLLVNQEVSREYATPVEAIINHDDTCFFPPDEAELLMSGDQKIMSEGETVTQLEYLTTVDGKRVFQATKGPVRDNQGKVVGLFGISRDITEWKRAEEELATSNWRLQLATDSARLGIWDWDVEQDLLAWDDRMHELYGVARDKSPGYFDSWLQSLHPDDRQGALQVFKRAIAGEIEYADEFRVLHPDGTVRYLVTNGVVLWDNAGKVVRMIGINRDITDQRVMESRLANAQKMEAIGRLAGGIAHDFNNKLSIILGYAEMTKAELSPEEMLWQNLDEISRAAMLSRDITRQLLSFSRQDHVAPRVVDLNKVLLDGQNSLSRLIGEEITILLEFGENLWHTWIDPAQLDQIIMNLAVNSRDSMPNGGKLAVTTANVTVDAAWCRNNLDAHPGDYVQLLFRDTGTGMSSSTIKHIFEPFYTTKDVGKGTGLGLATVFGIVTQNNGFIEVESEHGAGTTFRVFLPRHTGEPLITAAPANSKELIRKTVLLVEDDEQVRKMTALMLNRIGCEVIPVSIPQQAVDLSEDQTIHLDMVLSDVIMPGMSGKEMVDRIIAVRPEIKVLFMSGYSAEVVTGKGILDDDRNFIRKPFDVNALRAGLKKLLG